MDTQNIERLEAYLEGLLPPAERAELEAELRYNPALQSELDWLRDLRRGVELGEVKAFRDTLRQWDEKLANGSEPAAAETGAQLRPLSPPENRSTEPLFRQTWLRWAAVLLVLAAVLWAVFPRGDEPSPDSLIAEHFVPYPDYLTTMGMEQRGQLDDAMAAYTAMDYSRAAQLFATLDTVFPAKNLYHGIAELGADRPDAALTLLRQVQGEGRYAEAAVWYAAFATLKVEGNEAGKAAFSEIAQQGDHPFAEKAQAVVEAMD